MIKACSYCNRDCVDTFTEPMSVNFKGKHVTYPSTYSLCQHCGHEFITPEQIKSNEASLKKVWVETA